MINGLSLFANVGIAETYLKRVGVDIVVANELLPDRANFYKHLYSDCKMIQGDITNQEVFNDIVASAKKSNVEFIIATPPCQGMSTAGKKLKDDIRNTLIVYVVYIIKRIKPKYVLIENVPAILHTKICIDGEWVLINDYLKGELGSMYAFNDNKIINAMNYGVPQSRERCIYLLSRNDVKVQWEFPMQYAKICTMRDAIGDLPSLDPNVTDISKDELYELFPDYEKKRKLGEKVSKWHYPPKHKIRHVVAMMKTPEGKSAWENSEYYPKLSNGLKSKGYRNTYKRQWWDRPAYTVTKYTSRLGSQENGHPGRPIVESNAEQDRIWSDARVLTIFELIRIMSLPDNWNIPDWASSNLIREVIGEGIPPKLIENIVGELGLLNEEQK
ncbi:MAG: DNA cytosine methyltransferase [Bacillota bacterium]